MYIIKYRKPNKHAKELPFKHLSTLNQFIKTCVDNKWSILEIIHKEIEEI